MRRLFLGGVVVVVVLLVANLVPFVYVGADESWQVGDLSLVASKLGVEPEADGKYDLSKVLLAIADRLPWFPAPSAATGPFSLTVEVFPAESGTTVPSVGTSTYEPGTSVTVSAAPSPGYRFDHWEGAAAGSADQATLVMEANLSATAVFVRTYALSITAESPGGGTTSPSAGTYVYDTGTSVTVSATPMAGYRFDHWEGAVTGSADEATLAMDADESVTAVFAKTSTLSMTVESPGGGTTSPSAGTYTYDAGTSVSLSATPMAGYSFDHWEGGLSGSANPATLTLDTDKSVAAVFVECTVEIKDRDLEISRGSYATLHAQTTPNAYCSIDVYLPSGDKSQQQGLESKWSGADGSVFWTWLVSYNTDTGPGEITVTASANQASVKDTVSWIVLEPKP